MTFVSQRAAPGSKVTEPVPLLEMPASAVTIADYLAAVNAQLPTVNAAGEPSQTPDRLRKGGNRKRSRENGSTREQAPNASDR